MKAETAELYNLEDEEELRRFTEFAYKRQFRIRSNFPAPHLVADVAGRKEEEAGYQMRLWGYKEYLLVKKDSRLEVAVRDFMREGR